MEFSGTQTVAAPIEKVWAFLMDVNNVAACAPGFKSLEVLEEERWKAVIAVGIGAVKAKFTLDVTRPEMREPEFMNMKGRGKAPGIGRERQPGLELNPAAQRDCMHRVAQKPAHRNKAGREARWIDPDGPGEGTGGRCDSER